MATRYPDLFVALARPFDKAEEKQRPQGGRQLTYVTARTVMNRLDEVVGPENWWDEYFPLEHSVTCRLTIRLPDGETLTKSDAGGYAGMTDQGDDDKSGYSDAFKRAAVKFGVGRYLYKDGVAKLSKAPASSPARPPDKPMPGKTTAHVHAPVYRDWLEGFADDVNSKWVASLDGKGSAPAEIVNVFQLNKHLLKALGRRDAIGNIEASNLKAGEAAWKADSEAMIAEARVYCRKLWVDAKAKLKPAREPGADDMPTPEEEALLDRIAGTPPSTEG